mmetsp:Transcript_14478/g.25950  ORF Transcript_14478/g.25950 Transcript_14478/m.25950 type:complete len:261 (-) Transcript_14478:122-904(-)|eukprot:CAMPEP_0184523976 /NCGR_PEP_ID=MMETSP0198_2-20121128/9218_1 /TAXON_ID=1112570 /ORGANISM="Thraustochytrium sp., Strain LLF1b" /LENGTH=260 /DNA_ID=CAMNT_0026915137 /DNA_START=289 /DNA_END=1071 /DNA_ORIENTATION=-
MRGNWLQALTVALSALAIAVPNQVVGQDSEDPYAGVDLHLEDIDDEEDVVLESDEDQADDHTAGKFDLDDFSPSHVLTFNIAGKEDCFYEDISQKVPILLRGAYFVSSEAGMDVSVKVSQIVGTGAQPKENVLFSDYSKSEGTFSITAKEAGTYKICFQSAKPGKRVTFALHVGNRKREQAKMHDVAPMEAVVRDCHTTLRNLVSEQNFLINAVHRQMITQDSTESNIGIYTIIESTVMLAVTVAQIYYIQRLINNKQWV